MSDPAKTGNHENLSFNGLVEKLRSNNEDVLYKKLNDPVTAFSVSCSDLRKRRNKFIGHYDLGTMINSTVTPILEASRAEIKNALSCLRNAMMEVEDHYRFFKIPYEADFTSAGKELILSLKQAQRYRELVEKGTIPNEDLDSRL